MVWQAGERRDILGVSRVRGGPQLERHVRQWRAGRPGEEGGAEKQ